MTNGPITRAEPQDPTIEKEPDYRFTLANERTFLAWIRTALGLLAGGVAVHQLTAPLPVAAVRTAIAASCIVLAAVLTAGAYFHWRSVQQAMRRDGPLPGALLVPVLGIGVGVIVLIAGAALLIS